MVQQIPCTAGTTWSAAGLAAVRTAVGHLDCITYSTGHSYTKIQVRDGCRPSGGTDVALTAQAVTAKLRQRTATQHTTTTSPTTLVCPALHNRHGGRLLLPEAREQWAERIIRQMQWGVPPSPARRQRTTNDVVHNTCPRFSRHAAVEQRTTTIVVRPV